MPEWLEQALATPGLWWLLAALIAAGLVRGFSGFGSAMIIMPVASSVLSPFAALAFLTVVEFFGPLPNLKNALQHGSLSEILRLWIGVAVGLPIGLAFLTVISPDAFNWGVSLVVLALLVLLIMGWRYTGSLRPSAVTGIGGMGGFLGGAVGIPGPPVIMFYMSSENPIATIRANFLLYLISVDVVMVICLYAMDALDVAAILLALVLILPYMVANAVGALMFNPRAEHLFRGVAYVIIALSALLGLPVWS